MTTGYVPTRDEMLAIRRAAGCLYEAFDDWRNDCDLPCFPIETGSIFALMSIFDLEMALNPRRLPWDHPKRITPDAQVWGPVPTIGLHWMRRLLDEVMSRTGIQSMVTASTFQAWREGLGEIPSLVSIHPEEMEAFSRAFARIFIVTHDPSESSSSGTATISQSTSLARPNDPRHNDRPVELFSFGRRHAVLGAFVEPLSRPQYAVVEALITVGIAGLGKKELLAVSPDAIGILKRLKESDPNTWGKVIHFAGKAGRRYRIASPTEPHLTTPSQTSPPTQARTTPYRST